MIEDVGLLTLLCACLAAGVFLLTLVNTNAALILLIYSMLLSPELPLAQFPGRAVVVRFDDLLLGVVFITWLTKLTLNKQLGFLKPTGLNALLLLFIASSIISTSLGIVNGWVTRPGASAFYILKYFEYFFLFFMIANVLHERRQVTQFLTAMLITAGVVSLYGYLQLAQYGLGYRVSAPFEGAHPEPNTLAGYLILMMAVCTGLALYTARREVRFGLLGLVALMLPPFIFTYSRGGYVGFIMAFLTFCFVSPRYRIVLIVLFVVGAVAAPFVLPASVIERVTGTINPAYGKTFEIGGVQVAHSAAARFLVWEVILRELVQQPLLLFLGLGVTGAGLVDNQYALIIGEQGLVGMVIALWVRWRLLWIGYRTFRGAHDPLVKGLSLGFVSGLVGLLVHSFGGNLFVLVRVMEPFWFLAAVVTMLPSLVAQTGTERSGVR